MDPASPHEPAAPAPAFGTPLVAVVPQETAHRLRRGLFGVGVVAAVLLAGCGAGSTKGSAGDAKTSTSIASTTGPPSTVRVQPLPAFSDEPTVACHVDGLIPFPATALNGPTGAERATTPAAKALRADLTGSQRALFDSSGRVKVWRLAIQTDTDALFLGGDGLQRISQRYQLKDGKWSWTNFDSCGSTMVVAPGTNVVALNLDSNHPVDAKSTKVHLLATELACNGGVPFTAARIAGPQVHVDADRVVIFMAAQKPAKPLSKSCVSTDPIDVVVDIGEPLGSRQLINGNRFPYKPIT